jgi:hypothetical protein
MNVSVQSAECRYGSHGACTYEDCACRCHFLDLLAEQNRRDTGIQDDEEDDWR